MVAVKVDVDTMQKNTADTSSKTPPVAKTEKSSREAKTDLSGLKDLRDTLENLKIKK